MKLGICVGHSRPGDKGATSLWGETEHGYNSKVANALHELLAARGIASFVIASYVGSTYSAAIGNCAKQLRAGGATHAVELHFNAANGKAGGAEWLYWHKSTRAKQMCEAFQDRFLAEFPDMQDRGLKPRLAGQRGALFLQATPCPAAILEPFFGDNPRDAARFEGAERELAQAYANAVERIAR